MLFRSVIRTTVSYEVVVVRHLATARSKVVQTTDEALEGIESNITLLSGGFGLSGVPDTIINALKEKSHIQNITAVSNNAGLDGRGLSQLLVTGQITKMISSYIGGNRTFEKMYLTGKIDLELTPQGNLAERVRAGAAGIPAFYSPTGVGTWLEEGKLPVRYDETGTKVLKSSVPREVREFNGKKYLLEPAIVGDVAFVKAYKADTLGNCWFRGASRNFNSVMGRNAKLTIVEAENIVEPGEITPEDVHLPSIYVDRVIQSSTPKEIEIHKYSEEQTTENASSEVSEAELKRQKIVKRAAQEFQDGSFANLGIGMPTLAPNFLPDTINVTLQSENGILGLGPYPKKGEEDPDMINAGKETVTLAPGASLFGSEESFGMIRGGKIDLTILGGLQVSAKGDLANWGLPGRVKGMGGAMDLVSNPKATRVVVVMEHVDKKGRAKILNECKFPLTGKECVSRIITDLAVFDVVDGKLVLIEIDPSSSVEEVKSKTEAEFEVSPNLKSIEI
ncbi:3-oxoacid CoA-transferase Succinyl-CoA:alpha-ketoacid-CoA transferase [Scheffersomyces stipitis CBS 6054]|uniref:Succinyl-CoA:3-ketoacid-coenzyme A transferase n=1 Tax=Scheffersomyces stipitis (strain ATCC 58785 / CBS 6054 / NBRC 10063 / NRRL Y-11545) TaxID=322104 RepID=A3LYE2_PICST|nr:3-oxoacid CoA-transferase Succinyl-CoA:alpha-ketoacid-CoA transferase [Scheffersomyces stipitis CBS 6054]ABN67967.1 3-oxoacid CoA-transferase Succinyl-CoA:alpha-ketoacid-CoA transferase [Scheffersomyces stipitis CBS 6054]